MRKEAYIFLTALALTAGIASLSFSTSFAADKKPSKQDQVTVLKEKDTVFVRSFFSPQEDIVIRLRDSRNGQLDFADAGLLKSSEPMTKQACLKAEKIHSAGDDSTPWNINGTYIGGNHGCFGVQEITVKDHGFTDAYLGSEWTDSKGSKFYIVKIIASDRVWLLSENLGENGIWKFKSKIDGDTLKGAEGKELKISKLIRTQLIPSCRMKKKEYLVNGKTPLKDGAAVTCRYLDIVEEYDIISPDSVLEAVKENPGRKTDFTGDSLDSVITNKITYCFQPRGACTVLTESKANRPFNLGYMGFIQSASLLKGKFDSLEYYIPKTLPFEKNKRKYDFKNFEDFSARLPAGIYFNAKEKNIENPLNLPDRFIQMLGEEENGKISRKAAYVIGYSLFDGMTVPEIRAKNSSSAGFIHTSNKSYPSAVNSKMGLIPEGMSFKCMAYRQYYAPSVLSPNASSAYLHREGKAYVLYVDYHKAVDEDVITLPKKLIGKKVVVVENTPSVELVSGKTVTAKGVVLKVRGGYGYIVLKIE